MVKYKLVLDESGNFDSANEKYIIIGGLFYCENDEKDLEKIFIPLKNHICKALKINELHGSENKQIYNYIAPIIGSIKKIKSVVIVVDKYDSFIFKKYDKKSFKYNKTIEYLIKNMLNDMLIKYNDELIIEIDNINLNQNEIENLSSYLPNNYPFVKKVFQNDSKNNVFIQLSDVIVNKFSKKSVCKASSQQIKLLEPKIYSFLYKTNDDYIIE